jgi:hypothetical protein
MVMQVFLRSTPIDLEPRRDEATGDFFPWGLPEGDYSQKRLRRLQAQAFGGPFWDGHLMYGPQSSLGISRTPEQQFVDVLAARKREALRRAFPDATRLFRHRLQLLVVLNDISPPLYRRLTVAAGITLATLHSRVLAPALGWHRSQHCYQFIDRSDGALFGPGRAGDTTAAAATGEGEAARAPHPLADCRDLPHLHVKGYAMIDDRDVRLVELVRCVALRGRLPPRAGSHSPGDGERAYRCMCYPISQKLLCRVFARMDRRFQRLAQPLGPVG